MNIESPSARFFNLPGMRRQRTGDPQGWHEKSFKPLNVLPNSLRNHIIAGTGEAFGTASFLFIAFSGTQVANAAAAAQQAPGGSAHSTPTAPDASTLMMIALSFGFSLAVNAWVFFRVSGGLFNPAVTLGMALIGAVTWIRALVALVAQLCGAMAAAGIVRALFPGTFAVTTTLGTGVSLVRGVFIEAFLTAVLVFTIFMLAAEKHKGTFIAPVGIGLALFVCELSGVFFTGGSLNPARSFGPCVALGQFPSYHWVYWVGPALGSLLAVALYRFLKLLEYETANPGQDFDEKEDAALDVDEAQASTAKDVERPDAMDIYKSRQSNQVPGEGGRATESAAPYTNNHAPQANSHKPEPMHPGYSQQPHDYQQSYQQPYQQPYQQSYARGPSMEGGDSLGGRYRVSGLQNSL